MRNIHNGRYYYDFQRVVGDMMKDNPKCFVCGSTRNVGPHHIRKVKRNNQQYADRDNLVLLCKSCHSRYHNRYGNKRINQKTFALFVKAELHKRIRELEVGRILSGIRLNGWRLSWMSYGESRGQGLYTMVSNRKLDEYKSIHI